MPARSILRLNAIKLVQDGRVLTRNRRRTAAELRHH